MSSRLTTAAALVKYREELIEGGFTEEQAFLMARDVARDLIQIDGLGVRNDEAVSA